MERERHKRVNTEATPSAETTFLLGSSGKHWPRRLPHNPLSRNIPFPESSASTSTTASPCASMYSRSINQLAPLIIHEWTTEMGDRVGENQSKWSTWNKAGSRFRIAAAKTLHDAGSVPPSLPQPTPWKALSCASSASSPFRHPRSLEQRPHGTNGRPMEMVSPDPHLDSQPCPPGQCPTSAP